MVRSVLNSPDSPIKEASVEVDFNFDLNRLPECDAKSATATTLTFPCFKKIDNEELNCIDAFLSTLDSFPCVERIVLYGSRACHANGVDWDFIKVHPTWKLELRSYCDCVNTQL